MEELEEQIRKIVFKVILCASLISLIMGIAVIP